MLSNALYGEGTASRNSLLSNRSRETEEFVRLKAVNKIMGAMRYIPSAVPCGRVVSHCKLCLFSVKVVAFQSRSIVYFCYLCALKSAPNVLREKVAVTLENEGDQCWRISTHVPILQFWFRSFRNPEKTMVLQKLLLIHNKKFKKGYFCCGHF